MSQTVWFEGTIIFLLLASSFFFSGAETALTAVSRARIFNMAREGSRRAMLVERLREQKEGTIGTILMCNNVVNIVATAILTALVVRTLGEDAVWWVTAIFSVIVIYFSEILPKTIAIRHSETVALFSARGIYNLVWLLAPLNRAIQWTIRLGFRAFGADIDKPASEVTIADALKGTIDMHHHEGEMVKRERDMLGSILDLSGRTVDEVMVPRQRIETIDLALPVEEIVALVTRSEHSRIPFWMGEPDNVVGVLHVKDLLRLIASRRTLDHGEVERMLVAPWFVPDTTGLGEQLLAFRQRRRHFAVVVDEYGALLGIVTLEDIIEEIVGDIADEHDRVASAGIVPLGDGSYRVAGATTIRDLNRQLDWRIPDEDATTIAGYVLHATRIIPEQGAEFRFGDYAFAVEEKHDNQIVRLRVRRSDPAIERA